MPSKVIHVVENLNRGAVENWLVRMFRYGKQNGAELDWTFYCTLSEHGILDDEVRRLGGRIIFSPASLGNKWAFVRALRRELRRGNYDTLHCHHDLVSALYLGAALGLPIRKKLVHVHNADEWVPSGSALKRSLLREPLRKTCIKLADRIIGISHHTLDKFIRGKERREGKDIVHYYGVDPSPFLRCHVDRNRFRRELGLPENCRILLFAGRMVPEKNPLFAVRVLKELCERDPEIYGVFAGSGALEPEVKKSVEQLGLSPRTRLLGWRQDVPEIMCCCDLFILPHIEEAIEGLGLAVVEAQLGGLRLLLSKGIADDPLLPGAVTEKLGLEEGYEAWAEQALCLLSKTAPTREQAASALAASPFSMEKAFKHLTAIHE